MGCPYDPQMPNPLRLLCLTLSSLVLVACGGGDSGQSDSSMEGEDPRAGYFHAADSANLNPPLAKYNAAWTKYVQTGDACSKEASRLFAAGATPRAAVKCHFREIGAIIKGTAALRAATSELDGDYREACDMQIEDFATSLDAQKAAWERLNDDWTTYANGKAAPAGIQQHADTAGKQSQQFVKDEVPALTNACYIESDIAPSDS